MARRTPTDLSAFPALTIEGNLIAAAMVAKLVRFEAGDQKPEDYGVPKGEQLRDEIARYFRIGQRHWQDFSKAENPSMAATVRFAESFMREVFGFSDLKHGTLPVALAAGEGRVPITVVPRSDALDRASETLSADRKRSAALALQDVLNGDDEALWGLALNGDTLRLMRDNASFTRPAYVEADLTHIFRDEDLASFSALWLLIQRTRFGKVGSSATDCALERWREQGGKEGEAARERLSAQVQDALRELGSGFLAENSGLRERLQTGALSYTEFFNELLRLVYRLIFLMVAEDRGLLHPHDAKETARELYALGYSMAHLRDRAVRRSAYDRYYDRFEGMKVVFAALSRGEPMLGLPALGGLFERGLTPDLREAKLPNRAFMAAIHKLGWLTSQQKSGGVVPVNWRAMETEELGSVYESLLELQPQPGPDGCSLQFAGTAAEQKGNQRKTTGSYYTPDSLVQALLDTALDPVLDCTEAEADDPAQALLSLTVIDPACGSGHFLLAAARRIATRLARHRADGTPSAADYRHAMRDVARRVIHGVDRNEMAVELTKVALWIETVDPGYPLGYFDAQIRPGDSLLGVFAFEDLAKDIPDAAYKPLAGDDKTIASYYAKRNKAETKGRQGKLDFEHGGGQMPAAPVLARQGLALRALPENSLADIRKRRERYAELRSGADWLRLKTACDLYVAAFLATKNGALPANEAAVTIPTTGHLRQALAGRQLYGPLVAEADRLAYAAKAFHWPLEFPDVMARGGFDVVLGNPPWDTMSPDYKEFFAVYDANIRHMSPREQEEAYARLLSDPVLAARWQRHCADLYTLVHFIKSSGRYRLFAEGNLGKGDFNVYRMFVETALAATRHGGVATQLVPEGLYNGANATAIRRELFTAFRLEHIAGFENTKGIWFEKIDTRMKFCLYVAWKGESTEEFHAAFRVNSREKLQEFMTGGGLRIPISVVEEFSPDAVAVMEFAAQSEIDICARMYSLYPKFGEKINGVPHRHYMAEVHMGNNRGLFTEASDGLPVFEGRMIDAYDYRAKGYVSGRGRSAVWEDFPFGSESKRIQPQWRVPEQRIPEKLGERIYRYRVVFGDVASPTNQRGLIAGLLPGSVISGHTVPTIEFSNDDICYSLLWIGVANSFVMDFLVRTKVSLHMSYTIMDSLPFPRDFANTNSAGAIARHVCALCAVGDEMAAFRVQAIEAGILEAHEAVIEAPYERAMAAAEIDVLVARDIFGLTKQEMLYILDPDNILGPDCGVETFKALRNAELREFKEFRTQRLIEQAWDKV